MDWKLLFSTFALVFLAELGDKTQLTALAASAGSKSPWSVFIGASLALVVSTLIATLVGSALKSVLPEKVIKIAAAVLFLVFGGILLYTTLTGKEGIIKAAPAEREWKPGALERFALRMALEFEKSSVNDYEKYACTFDNETVCAVFREIAGDELKHHRELEALVSADIQDTAEAIETLPEGYPGKHPGGAGIASIGDLQTAVERAIAHENDSVEFYRSLAAHTPLPKLAAAFGSLAERESLHMRKLIDLRKQIV
ncbi:MAG: TMEM165/GDT1 family protein [Brevinematales bacterium]|nr:TMEM165/GDT1 family protein [Brevinematales bacterium]